MKMMNCEVQFNALFERTKDAVFLLDLKGVHIIANQKAALMFGYDEEEMAKLSYKSLSMEPIESEAIMKRLLAGEQIPKYRKRFRHKEGYEIPVEIDVELVKNSKGIPIYIQSIVQDIRERVAFEKTISYYSNFQKLIVQSAIDIIKASSDDLEAELKNLLMHVGEFCKVDRTYIFRYDFEKNVFMCTLEWHRNHLTAQQFKFSDIPYRFIEDWTEKHRSGSSVWINDISALEDNAIKDIFLAQGTKSFLTIPLNDQNECLGFMGYDSVNHVKVWTQDELKMLEMVGALVTNAVLKKRREHDLYQALHQAEVANLSKSNFMANMSHELRTPLNAISGMLQLMYKEDLSMQVRSYVENAERFSKSLLSSLNDILDYADIERGMLELEFAPFDLRKIIEEVHSYIWPVADDKHLSISILIEHDFPSLIYGDGGRIKQILTNLMSNSVKFTETGSVSLEVLNPLDTEELLFIIKDTGIGIEDSDMHHIFEPFTQGDASLSRRYGGAGLGLTIVKELITKMNGSINVSSRKDHGTTFYIKIPVKTYVQPTEHALKVEHHEIIEDALDIKSVLKDLERAIDAQKPKLCKVYLEQLTNLRFFESSQVQLKMLEKALKGFDFENALIYLKQLESTREQAYEKPQ